MSTLTSTARTAARALAVLAVSAALTLTPGVAHADDLEGTPGNDGIVGTTGDDTIDAGDGDDSVLGDGDLFVGDGGDDTINGGGGDDTIAGDGPNSTDGGDDTIHGGDGDDILLGDGVASTNGGDDTIDGGGGDDRIFGDGVAGTDGGDDHLYGGEGNDVIHGDGGETLAVTFRDVGRFTSVTVIPVVITEVNGGDDVLFGGPGDDVLHGDSGNDVLCGEDGHASVNPLDQLFGGLGTDIACAIDDEVTVDEGQESTLDLAANDDSLDDESDETQPLRYRLVSVPEFISAVLEELTGILTFTATQSGTLRYEVCRSIMLAEQGAAPAAVEEICSAADVAITATPVETTPGDGTTDDIENTGTETDLKTEPTVVAAQVLPNTGATTDPRVLVPLGLALLAGGALLLGTGRRRAC